jgi:hypothetical protein
MASPEGAQKLTNELLRWLGLHRPPVEPDDAVPALLITAVKIAVTQHQIARGDELIEKLVNLVKIAGAEELEKRDLERLKDRKIN